MFSNYRRNFFLLLILFLIILFTDSDLENTARLWFVSTFGLEVGGATSFTDYLSVFQNSIANQIYNLSNYVLISSQGTSGIVYIFWQIVGLLVSILKTIVGNTYLFYGALVTLLYFVLTSRLFRNSYDY